MPDRSLNYRKVRSIKEVIQEGFLYLSGHMKAFINAFLLFVIPCFAASTIFSYLLSGGNISYMKAVYMTVNIRTQNPFHFVAIVGTYFAGILFHNLIVNKHLILTEEAEDKKVIDNTDFKRHLLEDLKQHLPNVFFLLLTFVVLSAIFYQFFSWTTIFPEFPPDDYFTYLLELSLPLALTFFISPLVLYLASTALFVSFRDKMGIFQALAKVWSYTKEKLFGTWAVSVIAVMLAYLAILLLKIPFYALGYLFSYFTLLFDTFDTALIVLMSTANVFFYFFITAGFQIISIYQFTSLEEQKEGRGLQSIIEKI